MLSFLYLFFLLLLPTHTHTAKVELENINRWPNTPAARRANTDKAADFLRKDGVMMHHDAVKGMITSVKGRFTNFSPNTPELPSTIQYFQACSG